MIDPNAVGQKYKQYSEYGLYAATLLGCYLALPIILGAVQGLMLLIVFGVIGFSAWTFIPVLGDLIANWKMKAIIAIAEANPIETMKNLAMAKTEQFERANVNIRDFETSLLNFREKVKSLLKLYPEDAGEYLEIESKMTGLLADMKDGQQFAAKQLRIFEDKIAKAEVLYDMAKDANAMLEKSQSAQQEVFDKIKEQVSFKKVSSDLNRAFANMDMAIERRKNMAFAAAPSEPKALPEAQSEVTITDLGNVPVRQKVGTVR